MANRKPSYDHRSDDIEINAGRETVTLRVTNTGDRPVQAGSHFHFFEINRALSFDRGAAFGWRLDIPAGTAVRFEPGDAKEVTLVPLGGKQRVHGLNGLVDGWAPAEAGYRPRFDEAVQRAEMLGFKTQVEDKPKAKSPAKSPAKAKAPAKKSKGA